MNMTRIAIGVKTIVFKGAYAVKKYKPELLMGGSMICGAACIFFTRKAALKEQKIIEKHVENRKKVEEIIHNDPAFIDDPKKQRRLIWYTNGQFGWEMAKNYLPAAVFGLSSGLMSTIGFLEERKRTKNAIASLSAVLAAHQKHLEGKDMPELPSAEKTDSSKEGESSKDKVPKKLKDKTRTFELLFSNGSPRWEDSYARGPAMNVVKLQQGEIYYGLILDTGKKVTLNEIGNYWYPNYSDDNLHNPNCPAQWDWEEGQYWGLIPDPNGNNRADFGVGNLTMDNMEELLKGRDGGFMMKIKAKCLDPVGYLSYCKSVGKEPIWE